MQEMIEYITKQVSNHLGLSEEQILVTFAKQVNFSPESEKTYMAMIILDISSAYNEYDKLQVVKSGFGKTYLEALTNLAKKV